MLNMSLSACIPMERMPRNRMSKATKTMTVTASKPLMATNELHKTWSIAML